MSRDPPRQQQEERDDEFTVYLHTDEFNFPIGRLVINVAQLNEAFELAKLRAEVFFGRKPRDQP